MKPNGGGQATGKVAEWLDKDFDSFEPFKKQLSAAKAAVGGVRLDAVMLESRTQS